MVFYKAGEDLKPNCSWKGGQELSNRQLGVMGGGTVDGERKQESSARGSVVAYSVGSYR